MSVSVPRDELARIQRAARKAKKPLSTYMREAAVEKAVGRDEPAAAA